MIGFVYLPVAGLKILPYSPPSEMSRCSWFSLSAIIRYAMTTNPVAGLVKKGFCGRARSAGQPAFSSAGPFGTESFGPMV